MNAPAHTTQGSGSRGPLGWLLDLFSSVKLGITLLALLFLYSSIGSAGLPVHPNLLAPSSWVAVREMRFFELTEFEWFHYWPFDLLIALICVTLVVTTLRRIPFRVVNLGVWMIHTGIIILALGSVWYFGTKVEGDAPVARRMITIEVPGHEPQTLVAAPGNRTVVGTGEDAYVLRIQSIDRDWEIRSGDDAGKRAYSVSVAVQTPEQTFIRQLLAGYPEYTEDVIFSSDSEQPMQRAVKVLGKPLVDEGLRLSLDLAPQDRFYVMQSSALYLRELGATEWVERPIEGLPRFNDYIAARQDVWTDGADIAPDPLNVRVPSVSPADPLAGVDFNISRYLRHARTETRRTPGGNRHEPAANVLLRSSSGDSAEYQLLAFDPTASTAERGLLAFRWVNSPAELERMSAVVNPGLSISVPDASVEIVAPIRRTTTQTPDLEFTPVEGTDYAFRVQRFEDGIALSAERVVSLAVVEIRTPQRTFTRWVFDDPNLNRDITDEGAMPTHEDRVLLDEGIRLAYRPGNRPAPVTLFAGPEDADLSVRIVLSDREPRFTPVTVGEEVEIDDGITLTVLQYSAHTRTETRPFIVPPSRRDRDVGVFSSMVMVDVPAGGDTVSAWLPYHHYPFESPAKLLRRFPYQPSVIQLADGRRIEMMLSRRSMPLPAPVVLDDFQVDTHIGGFSGQTSSILNWTSLVRFDDDGTWGEPMAVSVNAPQEHDGFWFFQAQWDPPDQPRFEGDPGSQGLNYTVLGVGNREGVLMQLAGCCLAVIGMLYAFYVKPIIKRRRQNRVYAEVEAGRAAPATREAPEPAVTAWKESI